MNAQLKQDPRYTQGRHIRYLASGFDVQPLLREIAANPGVWNRQKTRTHAYSGNPHTAVSDIWVRYNPWRNFAGDPKAFNDEHESEWYPESESIPAVRNVLFNLMRFVEGTRLGGVLITRVPPGESVAPHQDHGWHAQHYNKFAIQLMGNDGQAFHFNGEELRSLPGDLYTFDNSHTHWVTNDSDGDRMTLIACIRT